MKRVPFAYAREKISVFLPLLFLSRDENDRDLSVFFRLYPSKFSQEMAILVSLVSLVPFWLLQSLSLPSRHYCRHHHRSNCLSFSVSSSCSPHFQHPPPHYRSSLRHAFVSSAAPR